MKKRKSLSIICGVFLIIFLLASVAIAGPPKGMKLYVMHSGYLGVDRSLLVSHRFMGQMIKIPILMFLVTHPDGPLLFDTGMPPECATDPVGYWGPIAKALPVYMERSQAIDRQLEALGFKLSDIKYVATSHMHLDHCGGMKLFPDAIHIMRRAALREAWWPNPTQRGYYILKDILPTRDFNFRQLGVDDYDVFGDGSVILIDTTGHAVGHQSCIVNLPKTGMVVLTQDACDQIYNLDHMIPPGTNLNVDQCLKAIRRFRDLRDKGALIIPSHDPDNFKTLKVSPKYYD